MNLERCIKGHFYDKDKLSNCPYCNEKIVNKSNDIDKNDNQTKVYIGSNIKAVVGWLVCIQGFEKGKDYRLVKERNFVGNSEDMDIYLRGDEKIENKIAFTITYNENQQIFVLSPKDTGNIIYINKKAIYESCVLDNYSLIEIADTKLVFTKFCGENFRWEI